MLPKMTKYRWLLKEMHLRSLIKPIFTGARNLGKWNKEQFAMEYMKNVRLSENSF